MLHDNVHIVDEHGIFPLQRRVTDPRDNDRTPAETEEINLAGPKSVVKLWIVFIGRPMYTFVCRTNGYICDVACVNVAED